MEKLTKDAEAVLLERFGKDSIIGLATTADNVPYVRNVDAYYEDGAFYVLTYSLSNKMKQIEANPMVAISGFWFLNNKTLFAKHCKKDSAREARRSVKYGNRSNTVGNRCSSKKGNETFEVKCFFSEFS